MLCVCMRAEGGDDKPVHCCQCVSKCWCAGEGRLGGDSGGGDIVENCLKITSVFVWSSVMRRSGIIVCWRVRWLARPLLVLPIF